MSKLNTDDVRELFKIGAMNDNNEYIDFDNWLEELLYVERESSRANGYDDGYYDGHENGYEDGYNSGYDSGYDAGRDEE